MTSVTLGPMTAPNRLENQESRLELAQGAVLEDRSSL